MPRTHENEPKPENLQRDAWFFSSLLGDETHDYLSDAIENESKTVWSGTIRGGDDDYGVWVHDFHGVHFVFATDWFDPIGYFLDEQKAIDCVHSTWEDVDEGEEGVDEEVEDEDEDDAPE